MKKVIVHLPTGLYFWGVCKDTDKVLFTDSWDQAFSFDTLEEAQNINIMLDLPNCMATRSMGKLCQSEQLLLSE